MQKLGKMNVKAVIYKIENELAKLHFQTLNSNNLTQVHVVLTT